jgi:hypothetical protein
MAATITLTALDDQAEPVVHAFAERTGLTPTTAGDAWIFDVDGQEHGLNVVQTLTDIDPSWTDHVGLQDPA